MESPSRWSCEVGFSENPEDLRSDVGQWLVKAGGKTCVVVMVDIQEDQTACQDRQATQAFKPHLSELLRDFGNEKAKLKHGIEAPEADADCQWEDSSARDADSDASFSSQSDEDMYEVIRRRISIQDWLGPLSVNMEIWRLIGSKAERTCGPIVNSLPFPLSSFLLALLTETRPYAL